MGRQCLSDGYQDSLIAVGSDYEVLPSTVEPGAEPSFFVHFHLSLSFMILNPVISGFIFNPISPSYITLFSPNYTLVLINISLIEIWDV